MGGGQPMKQSDELEAFVKFFDWLDKEGFLYKTNKFKEIIRWVLDDA